MRARWLGLLLVGLLGACKKDVANAPSPAASAPRAPSSAELLAAPQQLRSKDANARLQALHLLLTSGSPRAVEPLLRALETPPVLEQTLAALGLGLLRDQRALAPLIRLSETSSEELLLSEVAWALGQFPGDHARAPLAAILRRARSSSDRSAEQAAASLASWGDAEANGAVISADGAGSMALLGVLPVGLLEQDPGPDPDLAERLALRPECDAIMAILRWSREPVLQGARGLYVSASLLEGVPEGCGEALRGGVARAGGGDAALLAGRATPADIALLEKLARAGDVRYEPAEVLHRLGLRLPVGAVSEAAVALASPLDPAWPNALWHRMLKPLSKDDLPQDPLDDVGVRAFAPVLRQLTGSGGTARYELDTKLRPEQLFSLALGRRRAPRKPSGERGFVTLLGLANPDGPEALAKLLEQTESSEVASHWLDSSVTLAFFELETAKLIELSRSAAPTLKAQALANLTWRDDHAAHERVQQAISESDPVAQRAVVSANVYLNSGRPMRDFAALLGSSDARVMDAVIEGIIVSGAPSDAEALDLPAREAALEARADMVALLAAVEPARAEKRLLAALVDSDPAKRARAEKWLGRRHYPAASQLESRLVLRAITDESLGAARGALLGAGAKLASEDVRELLHRAAGDASRQAFSTALERPEPELKRATAEALARVIEAYPPDPVLRELMVKYAARIFTRLPRKTLDNSFTDQARQQTLARGLVLWLGTEPKLGPELGRLLLETDRPSELHALLRLQPRKAIVEPLLEQLPKLAEPGAMMAALEPVLSTEQLPLLLARLAQRDSPLRRFVYALVDEERITAPIAANPALREPLRALLMEKPAADDYWARNLQALAVTIATRARDPVYASLLSEADAGKPPLAALYGRAWSPRELGDLLVSQREPELSALLPRLQQAPRGTLDWLRAARARDIRLPASSVLPTLGSTENQVPLEAARYLAQMHERERWLQVLTTLCANESPAQVVLDTQRYSVDELAQGSRAEQATTRACALGVLGRRAPTELGPRILEATRDASPLVRRTALELATLHPEPDLGARALAMLEAGSTPALRPWALAAWLVNNRSAAPRFLAVGPLLRGSLKLPRIFSASFDECSYWLPLAAVRNEVAEAQYLSFAYDRGNPGADRACALDIWLPLAWSASDFLRHYERAPRTDRELLLEALLASKLPLDASYASVLERVAPDLLRFDGPAYKNLPRLLDRLLELPKPVLKPLFDELFRDQPLDLASRKLVGRVRALL